MLLHLAEQFLNNNNNNSSSWSIEFFQLLKVNYTQWLSASFSVTTLDVPGLLHISTEDGILINFTTISTRARHRGPLWKQLFFDFILAEQLDERIIDRKLQPFIDLTNKFVFGSDLKKKKILIGNRIVIRLKLCKNTPNWGLVSKGHVFENIFSMRHLVNSINNLHERCLCCDNNYECAKR